MNKYDCAIIGAGPGGYVAALRGARRGLNTVVIEKEHLGGTCLNWGCIPTKALLHVSELAWQMRSAEKLGLGTGRVTVDFSKAAAFKDKVVKDLRQGVGSLFKHLKVQLVSGTAKLTGKNSIAVTDQQGKSSTLQADNIVIATGTQPSKLPGFDFDGQKIMNTNDVLAMTSLPKSILIVGGGIAGCEFATMFAEFGLQVTVVELLGSLLPTLDPDISKLISRTFSQRKIDVHTSAKITKLSKSASGITAELEDGKKLQAECALISIGRTTNLTSLHLESAGVANDGKFIKVDASCRTNVPGIWAIGEVAGAMPLAHVASRMGIVAAENIAGSDVTEDFAVVPFGIFTHPEIGVVGLNESQAAEAGLNVKVAKFPLQASGIARAYNSTNGFAKIIADKETGEIIGASMVCPHAADVVQQVALAMKTECTVKELIETIHTHPTFSEALAEAGEAWLDQALHSV